jgi:purine-binding chemotaxis protein CheW
MSALHVRVRVAGEAYAFPVADVLEIADYGEVARVPGAPAAILGVRNLRGQVLPVVDLASVLGLSPGLAAERIVVAESGGRRAGLAVDSVDDVEELSAVSEETASPHLAGAVITDGALVGLVNLASVLDSVQGAPAA